MDLLLASIIILPLTFLTGFLFGADWVQKRVRKD